MSHVIPLWFLSSCDMRALELQRLSGMGESLGDRTLRVGFVETFQLAGTKKSVLKVVVLNLKGGHIVLLGW